jgi:hypothetical protein
VNKTLTKKLIYVIAVLAILAMMIPAAIPASAAPPNGTPYITMNGGNGTGVEGNPGYNIAGSVVTVQWFDNGAGNTFGGWSLANNIVEPYAGAPAIIVSPDTNMFNPVHVQGTWGGTNIQATQIPASGNNTYISVEKKWGQIDHTAFSQINTASPVTWNEATKSWSGNASLTDTVWGNFYDKDPVSGISRYFTNVAAGAVLKWYLIPGNVTVDMTPSTMGNITALEARMAGYQANGPMLTSFAPWPAAQLKTITNYSGQNGSSPTVTLYAKGEEAVQIVVIPEYPVGTVNFPIVPEITSYDFYTTEMDVVPQVRWAGEKIVLEKNFGMGTGTYASDWVKFSLQNQSVGSLEAVAGTQNIVNGDTVWTRIDQYGFASCILTSSDEGVSQVTAALYNYSGAGPVGDTVGTGTLINQHYFTVYFLKFESLTLGDVQGKRAGTIADNFGHASGLWQTPSTTVPTNPWDPSGTYNNTLTGNNIIPDSPTQTLNVSQDALLRARVKGWFTSSNPSARPLRYIDPANSSGMADPTPNFTLYPATGYPPNTLLLPAGRWILPDDWAALAGVNWQQSRLHWDIMCDPFGAVGSTLPQGLLLPPGGANTNTLPIYMGTVAASPAPAPTTNTFTVTPAPGLAGSGLDLVVNGQDMGAYSYTALGFVTLTGVPPGLPNNVVPPQVGQPVSTLATDYMKAPITGPATVSGNNVIGPFSPGLELMTPTGWTIPNKAWDPNRLVSTVVPDGNLDMWDAPMPPAKIIFQIQKVGTLLGVDGLPMDQAGFFKAADKDDIYYIMVSGSKVYTNPFYKEMIPSHEAIPPFINNGGYDWDSFGFNGGTAYGPYNFWFFINQGAAAPMPLVATTDASGHPTNVEVYSDNHGEAMVWVNGSWNLDLTNWAAKGYADIPLNPLTTVGATTIQATADYPYSRAHQAVQSNKDVKTWTWGGQILGTDGPSATVFGDHVTTSLPSDTRMVLSAGSYVQSTVQGTFPNQAAKSNDKVVWVWVTDRDGNINGIDGAQITWTITDPTQAKINTTATGFLSDYNAVTRNIFLSGGFLTGTNGYATSTTVGYSSLRKIGTGADATYLTQLFNKFWGPSPAPNPSNPTFPTLPGGTSTIRATAANYEVAALDLSSISNLTGRVNVTIQISSHDFDAVMGQATPGTLSYNTNIDFTTGDALDDGIRVGDANCDGSVNMADVTTVERMILGYQPVTSNSIVNKDGTVDMGTVVKIERTILGLP